MELLLFIAGIVILAAFVVYGIFFAIMDAHVSNMVGK